MIKTTPLIISLFLFPLLPGCAAYDGLAYFHRSGELLELSIDKSLSSKTAALEARGADGLVCSGTLRTVHPRSAWWGGCSGEDGKFVLACNDGRHLMGVWNAENCSNGQGVGGDQYGNTFVMAYGDTRSEVLRKIGVGPEGGLPAFAESEAVNPLYSSLLGQDGADDVLVLNSREAGPAQVTDSGRGVAGFFTSPDGLIATSSVGLSEGLGERDSLSVYLPAEGREVPARVIEIRPDGHVAILQVEAEGRVGAAVRVIVRREPPEADVRR